MSQQSDSLTSIFFALGANAAIAGAKLFAAFYTGSNAMLAEAIHSCADCGNQGLLLLGLRRAKKPPTPDFPLGFGKAIYFWSFIVALLLFSLGGVFAIYEGWHRLDEHGGLEAPWLAVGILGFSMAMETVSLFGCLREIGKSRGGKSLWQWCKQTRQSELLVVLGEDVAALFGLLLALLAIVAAILTGDPKYDAMGSITVGALLVLVACGVALKIHGLLIGQSAEPEVRAALLEYLESREEVERVYNLITLQLGAELMVAVKAHMRGQEAAAMIAAINRCEAGIKERFPQVKWIFFEPDVAD